MNDVRRSLPVKLLLAVFVCAVLPLAGVGIRLTSMSARSGELLLRSQLDSTVARASAAARTTWQQRRSDVLFLAGNGPTRSAFRAETATRDAPPFVRRAFETMPSVVGVVARDTAGRVRWSLGEIPRATVGPSAQTSAPPSPLIPLSAPIVDDDSHIKLGEVEARIRLDALAPSLTTTDAAPSDFLALHDRANDTWLRPVGLPSELLDEEHFSWNGRRWLVVRERLEDPAIDIFAAATLDPFLTPFARNARAGAIGLGLSAIVVVVLTIVVTNRLTSSLGQLAMAADRVAGGDLDTRVDVTSHDEVGRVASAFNGMMDNVRRMMRELSQREAVAAMGELAATLAHQLRSPATAIRLDVQRAHDKLPADSPERALLARSLGQLDRLERAISGSLKVARSAGAEFKDLDLRQPLARAIDATRREHSARGISIDDSAVSKSELLARGDASSLEQLFSNILANAAQAAPQDGRIRVTVENAPLPSEVAVSIHDNGLGMTDAILARAGEPLFSTKAEGTGLGLAIAKRIAAAHGGGVTITSAPGAGTTVRVALPRTN